MWHFLWVFSTRVCVCIFVGACIDAVHWLQARAQAHIGELYANEEFMQAVHHKHEQWLGLQYWYGIVKRRETPGAD